MPSAFSVQEVKNRAIWLSSTTPFCVLFVLTARAAPSRPPQTYRQVSNIRRTLVGNEIVDHSGVVGASPVGAAPTTSSFSTEQLASIYCAKTTASQVEKHLRLKELVHLILEILRYVRDDGSYEIHMQTEYHMKYMWSSEVFQLKSAEKNARHSLQVCSAVFRGKAGFHMKLIKISW